MGVVGKAGSSGEVTPSGPVDVSTMIREAVEAEIERRRLEKLAAEKASAVDDIDRP